MNTASIALRLGSALLMASGLWRGRLDSLNVRQFYAARLPDESKAAVEPCALSNGLTKYVNINKQRMEYAVMASGVVRI